MTIKIFIFILFMICSCSNSNIETSNNSETFAKIDKQEISIANIWNEIDNKALWFKEDSKLYRTIDSLPKDFIYFYTRFITDSTFQAKHLKFPILAAVSECDSTIVVTNKNWENFIGDFRKDFYNPKDSNLIFFNNDKFYFERNIRETGLVFQIGFEKLEGNWYLTLYMVDVC